MFNQIAAYLRFLARSTNDHGVHSPFIYTFITRCLYDRKPYLEYDLLSEHRSGLLQDQTAIRVNDFGAGSKVFSSDKRNVSAIARHAGISRRRARMLFRIVSYFKPDQSIELGTSVGLATLPIALGHTAGSVHSAEGCKATITIANEHLIRSGISNVTLYNQEFTDFLSGLAAREVQADLVYIDGNHTKAGTLAYFNALLSLVSKDSVLIFDDIHWSPEMEEAWEIIKRNPSVTVTIDTFQWGFVFFRSGQEKEHFTIRC